MDCECLTLWNTEVAYTRLKAVAWAGQGLSTATAFEKPSGDLLGRIVSEVKPGKPLVVNCSGMSSVEHYGMTSVQKVMKDTGRMVVFSVELRNLQEDIERQLGQPNAAYHDEGQSRTFLWYGRDSVNWEEGASLVAHGFQAESDEVRSFVRESFHLYESGERRMTSTPILSNGLFDARSIICDPRQFCFITLCMTDMISQYVNTRELRSLRPWRLLSVSLRGAPFAAAVCNLLPGTPLEIEIIDHMGPLHQILEEYSLDEEWETPNYIFIADYIVGGTELKTAQTFARTKGCSVEAAFAIGTLLDASVYSAMTEVHSIANLRKVRPDAKFSI